MTVQELNDSYDNLSAEIYKTLNDLIAPNDNTIVYELGNNELDEGNYEYWVDAYDNNGSTYELSIIKMHKNGEIYGYVGDLDEYWTIYSSDIFNTRDKLVILNILSNE